MGCGGSKPKTHGGTKKGSTRGGTKKGGKTHGGGSRKSKASTKHGGPPHPATAGSHIPTEGRGPPSGFGGGGVGGGGGVSVSSGPSFDPGSSIASGGDFRSRIATAGPNQLLLIRFFKIDCEKCLEVGQFYQGLVTQYPQVIFLDANLARNLHAIGDMQVMSVPTFIAFKNHHEIGRYVGTDTRQVEALVTSNL